MFPVLADVVWPALLLADRLSAWWCIVASILLEATALWRFAQVQPAKALVAATVMNVVSALCGALLLPSMGIRWETIANLTYNAWIGWGTFNWITQIVTWCIAVLLSTIIEIFVLWLVFSMPWTRRLTVVMLSANAVTVALAWGTMLIVVPK